MNSANRLGVIRVHPLHPRENKPWPEFESVHKKWFVFGRGAGS